MSPPLFLLGFLSTLSASVITHLGLSSTFWTFGVFPLFSIYFLCNQQKLWEARNLVSATVVLFSIPWVLFTSIHCNPWWLWVVLVWLLCMFRAYDFEKRLYMMDTYGAAVKFLVWKVLTRFIGEAKRMSYKGEWAYCCPYSRKPVEKEIDHYYVLEHKENVFGTITSLEDYEVSFAIESCTVLCTYTSGSDASGDMAHASDVVPSPVKSPPPHKGESSSAKVEPGVSNKYSYILVPSHVDKLELSLKYENKALERYVFFNRAPDAVMELKRVLAVLAEEGIMIFSTFHRKNGSDRPQAHASCHEFGELLNLVLNRNHKLQKVGLQVKFECIISGSLEKLNRLLLVVVIGVINYYQLNAVSLYIVIPLVVLFGLLEISNILCSHVTAFGRRNKMKRFILFLIEKIEKIFPGTKVTWYELFLTHFPCLTFHNESYGYPYTSNRETICVLGDRSWNLTVTDIEDRIVCKDFQLVGPLREGLTTFTLRNRNLDLHLRFRPENMVLVNLRMIRNGAIINYSNVRVHQARVSHLIALMTWLEENYCVGVCKELARSNLVYAYRYQELFEKVLEDGDDWGPSILFFQGAIAMTVE